MKGEAVPDQDSVGGCVDVSLGRAIFPAFAFLWRRRSPDLPGGTQGNLSHYLAIGEEGVARRGEERGLVIKARVMMGRDRVVRCARLCGKDGTGFCVATAERWERQL